MRESVERNHLSRQVSICPDHLWNNQKERSLCRVSDCFILLKIRNFMLAQCILPVTIVIKSSTRKYCHRKWSLAITCENPSALRTEFSLSAKCFDNHCLSWEHRYVANHWKKATFRMFHCQSFCFFATGMFRLIKKTDKMLESIVGKFTDVLIKDSVWWDAVCFTCRLIWYSFRWRGINRRAKIWVQKVQNFLGQMHPESPLKSQMERANLRLKFFSSYEMYS